MSEVEIDPPFPIRVKSPIRRVISPFQEYMNSEATSGLLLIISVVVAILWANVDPSVYRKFWDAKITIQISEFGLSKSLLLWINDFLMAIFFLLVGLEIKRELLIGHIKEPKKALLPISAAIGGVLLPVGIYFVFNAGRQEFYRGWPIPAATDIAFALGVLYLFGDQIPKSVKMFLAILAITDDLIAITIIAVFFTTTIETNYLVYGILVFILLIGLNYLNVHNLKVYLGIGSVLWFFVFKSGIHGTIAGVLLAMTIPISIRIDYKTFQNQMNDLVNRLPEILRDPALVDQRVSKYMDTVASIEHISEDIQAPLARLEHSIRPFVSYLIVPLFALANAGVILGDVRSHDLFNSMSLGIIIGLTIGKPLGIFLFTTIVEITGLVTMPEDLSKTHVLGIGFLAGIGFTMSILMASLSFSGQIFVIAKSAILLSSVISGIIGYIFLRTTLDVH